MRQLVGDANLRRIIALNNINDTINCLPDKKIKRNIKQSTIDRRKRAASAYAPEHNLKKKEKGSHLARQNHPKLLVQSMLLLRQHRF
jgi:hypothetical protein